MAVSGASVGCTVATGRTKVGERHLHAELTWIFLCAPESATLITANVSGPPNYTGLTVCTIRKNALRKLARTQVSSGRCLLCQFRAVRGRGVEFHHGLVTHEVLSFSYSSYHWRCRSIDTSRTMCSLLFQIRRVVLFTIAASIGYFFYSGQFA